MDGPWMINFEICKCIWWPPHPSMMAARSADIVHVVVGGKRFIKRQSPIFLWNGMQLHVHREELHSIMKKIYTQLFSSPDPEGHVSYCYSWASVVCRPSVVVNFSHLNLLLWNHWANLNQTWKGWSFGGPLSELCPTTPFDNQDGRHC